MSSPNIIFILIDDMGWRDLGCYGSGFYETPNLDRLAAQGMRFTDAYASCPVCSPTRASVMTGKYPARVGLTQWVGGASRGKLMDVPYVRQLEHEHRTIATALREGGYQTWHVGKWHLGTEPYWPEKHGFDVNVGGCEWGAPRAGYFSPYKHPNLSDGPPGEYLTDRITDEAIRLIEGADERPFFLNFWHYAVHNPIQAKEKDIARFEQKAKRLGLDRIDPMELGEPFPCLHKKHLQVQRRRIQSNAKYAAMVWNLDENIGRLLDALERTGRAQDTLVVFTSDNGGLSTAEGSPTCNAPLSEGKGWMYDGGVREPLIVKWPGRVRAGSMCETPVTSTDYYPTFLEAAGLAPEPEHHVDGVSLMPLLREAGDAGRGAIFWHYPHYSNQGQTPGCAIREGDYKLIEFFEDGHVELYNLREDISEARDLASVLPEVARALHEKLVAWREAVGGRMPEVNAAYETELAEPGESK